MRRSKPHKRPDYSRNQTTGSVALGAEWLAVAVDTGIEGRHSADIKEATARNLRLAEELGPKLKCLSA